MSVARAPQAPGAQGFAFLKDEGGDENAQVYYEELAEHSARALTSGKSLHGSLSWSHDGKRLAFYGNDRDGVNFDVYVADIAAGGAPRLLVGAHEGTWYPLDWSLDDRKLLLWKYFSVSESYLYLADVATGELTALEKQNRKVGIRAARFAPDGRGIYVVSDEEGEFAQLHYVDIVTHATRTLTAQRSLGHRGFRCEQRRPLPRLRRRCRRREPPHDHRQHAEAHPESARPPRGAHRGATVRPRGASPRLLGGERADAARGVCLRPTEERARALDAQRSGAA